MDQWLETGRQLVDGVSGRRPGQRRGSLDLDSVGRWVGEKVEWLLEDEDDWREPWQEQKSPSLSVSRTGKRPLEAISRRSSSPRIIPDQTLMPIEGSGAAEHPPQRTEMDVGRSDPVSVDDDQSWPDDDSFRVEHWKRETRSSSRRALPRSSRRRA